MIDSTSPELRAAYVLALADLDRLFSRECHRKTVGFFPTARVWACPNCGSTIDDVGIPSPQDMLHTPDCEWLAEYLTWPTELIMLYTAAWMQRNPQSKRFIRGLRLPEPTSPSGS